MPGNPFKSYSVNSVFFFSFFATITLLFGLVAFLYYQNATREITERVSHYQQRLLDELNHKVTENLLTIERTAITASRNLIVILDRMQDGDRYEINRAQNEIRRQLNNFVFSMPNLNYIHVYSNHRFNSDNTADWVKFYPMSQLPREPWFGQIENVDSAWIGEHTIDTLKGPTSVISFALKAYNNSMRYEALIVLNVNTGSFQSILATGTDQSGITLLDSTGKPITHVGPNRISPAVIEDLIESSDGGKGAVRLQNEFVVWSTSKDFRWTIVETTPWDLLTEGSRELSRKLIIMGIAAILATSALVYWLSRQFTKPILILLKEMSSFAIRRKADIPTDYKNEFGGLFQGYQKLVRRIEEMYDSLEENHKRQTAAEIKSLQMMINPHFLYNTLDQINWMAIENGQTKISAMLSHVANMFRMSLSNPETLVPLREEITHIRHYLEFQAIRWGEHLRYSIHVDNELLDMFVPKIILQPFIENAFIHGFHGRQSAQLAVTIRRQDSRLVIEIEDDGNGLNGKRWESAAGNSRGHGLRNVRERIEALFGQPYGFTLQPGKSGAGTLVRIELPIVEKEGEDRHAGDEGAVEDRPD